MSEPIRVRICVPGAGRDWKKSVDITLWIIKNIPHQDAKVSWDGLQSDNGTVVFTHKTDAIAFKLKFPEWT